MTDDRLILAIQDLTRVTVAFGGNGAPKSEFIRRLSAIGMPPSRIGPLLGMPAKDVNSQLSKERKATKPGKGVRKAKNRD